MMLDWIKLQSSAIAAVAYKNSSLYIKFTTGRDYEYFHVPPDIYKELLNAASAGQFVNAYIKHHYQYRRIK